MRPNRRDISVGEHVLSPNEIMPTADDNGHSVTRLVENLVPPKSKSYEYTAVYRGHEKVVWWCYRYGTVNRGAHELCRNWWAQIRRATMHAATGASPISSRLWSGLHATDTNTSSQARAKFLRLR